MSYLLVCLFSQDLRTTASTSNHIGQRFGLCFKAAETRLHFQRRLDADRDPITLMNHEASLSALYVYIYIHIYT